MIIKPEGAKSPLVASLLVYPERHRITTVYPERNERFVSVVLHLGYRWSRESRCWYRNIKPATNGPLDDRAAELGYTLLRNGFIVDFPDESLAQRAIGGAFEDEQRLWVMGCTDGPCKGWFALCWPRDRDFYHCARRLPGSRYERPHVFVPPESFAEVQDFAEQHGFSVSATAQQIIEQAQAQYEATVMVVSVPERKKPQAEPVAADAGGIDPELLDDDLDTDN